MKSCVTLQLLSLTANHKELAFGYCLVCKDFTGPTLGFLEKVEGYGYITEAKQRSLCKDLRIPHLEHQCDWGIWVGRFVKDLTNQQ